MVSESSPLQPLVVMTVFFGPLPPWTPLTLHSMAANDRVRFVIVGDARPPDVLPPNVRFETIAYDAMQVRLSQLAGRRVAYDNTYKANDIKPVLPALYPEALRGFEWWGWADLDVVFGDLLKFVELAKPHPACCRGLEQGCNKKAKLDPSSPCFNSSRPRFASDTFSDRDACPCTRNERVTAISPLYPNPWRKKCWGPFTLFRVDAGANLYAETPKWRAALATPDYTHFDEWWGPFVQKGYESMGDVMTRLSDEGRLVMSRKLLPFSEAKSCVDIECTFCPCGATRMKLHGRTLLVNDEESMILHLAESKPAWLRLVARNKLALDAALADAAVHGWALPAYAHAPPPAGRPACFEAQHLGAFAPDAALSFAGRVARDALTYSRHRPLSTRAAAALGYLSKNASVHTARAMPPLTVRSCAGGAGDAGGAGGGGDSGGIARAESGSEASLPASPTSTREALRELSDRYDAFTGAERMRTLGWLCAWQRLSEAYNASLRTVDTARAEARRLPLLFGNRRIRFGLYGGERVGWWRQTVNTSAALEEGPLLENMPQQSCGLADGCTGACDAVPAPCQLRKSPTQRKARGRRGRTRVQPARRLKMLGARGRQLKARRMTVYDLKGPSVDGVPCLPHAIDHGESLEELQHRVFDAYLQLQKVQRDERARFKKWQCSWLYKLRACDLAEELQISQRRSHDLAEELQSPPATASLNRCRRIAPPDFAAGTGDPALGWGGTNVSDPTTKLDPLLFSFRCW